MTTFFSSNTTQIVPPVHSISVNKHRVIFTDSQGEKNTQLANANETRLFIGRLVNS